MWDVVASSSRWLLNEDSWLTSNLTWSSTVPVRESVSADHYPKPEDLIVAILLCPLWLASRYLTERYLSRPLGVTLGIKGDKKLKNRKREKNTFVVS